MALSHGHLARGVVIFVAAAIAGGFAYSYFLNRIPPVPNRPLRIGFEPNPPFQIRTDTGFTGLAVEIVSAAAKRAGLRLIWVETGSSSDESFARGLVDLWPLMADLPERRSRVHFSAPWVMGSQILIVRAGSPVPDQNFAGPIALFKLPLHLQLLKTEYPRAQPVPLADARDVLREVCRGTVAGGFLEKRVAIIALREMPHECSPSSIRVYTLPDLALKSGVASTFEAAGAADLLRREIGNLFRDGTVALTVAKYSFFGLDDAWGTYDLLENSERGRWIAWATGGCAVGLTLALWQTFSLRQRKRTEKVLRESRERFRAIFQQAGVGVAEISLNGKIELANDRYCEVLGHARADLLGKGTVELSHHADLKQEIEMLPRLLAGEMKSFSTEKRYARRDGTIVWATVCRTVVRDDQGRPQCFIAVVEDITERRQAEAALKESEQRFRNMADSAPVLIWMAGADKLCTFFNRAWLHFTGQDLEQDPTNSWAECVHPDDHDRCLAAFTSAFDARRDFQMEYRLRRADGEYRWFLGHGTTRSYSGGTFAGYIACSVDITDLTRSYQQHLATQKLESVGILAAGIAHDFNNLLGAIVAHAETAQADLAPDSDSPPARDLEQIRQTALRAAQIASQLMTFTRQETAPATSIDLSQLIAEMLDLLSVSVSKSAVLQTELAPDLPLIRANPSEIRHVVMNLIINASEALDGRAGSIVLTTAREPAGALGARVRLEIRDTGSGMSAETASKIFDPFFTTRFVGRGLGLSAVQGIIRRLGGSIEVESAPGSGSRFIVHLPAEVASPAAQLTHDGPDNRAVKPLRTVLFVEDEDSLRTAITKLLRKRHYTVAEAHDGRSALEIFESDPGRFDIVLLDVTLPGMPGAEIYDELRRISPDVKVMLSTAYSEETAMAQFGEREICGFIRKPYRIDDLVKVLCTVEAGSCVSRS